MVLLQLLCGVALYAGSPVASPPAQSVGGDQSVLFDPAAFRRSFSANYVGTPDKKLLENNDYLRFRFQSAVETALRMQLGEIRVTFLGVQSQDDPSKLAAYLLDLEPQPVFITSDDFETNRDQIATYEDTSARISKTLPSVRRCFQSLFSDGNSKYSIQVSNTNRSLYYRVQNNEMQIAGLGTLLRAETEPSFRAKIPTFSSFRTLYPSLLRREYKLPQAFRALDPGRTWNKVLSACKSRNHKIKVNSTPYEANGETTIVSSNGRNSVFVTYRIALYRDAQRIWKLGIAAEAKEDGSGNQMTNSSYEEELLSYVYGGLLLPTTRGV